MRNWSRRMQRRFRTTQNHSSTGSIQLLFKNERARARDDKGLGNRSKPEQREQREQRSRLTWLWTSLAGVNVNG
jgi:hypothetical protein